MWGQNCQEPGFSGTGDLWFGNELASQALPPPLTFSKTKRPVFHGSLEHRSRSARGVASRGGQEDVPPRLTRERARGVQGHTGGAEGVWEHRRTPWALWVPDWRRPHQIHPPALPE